MYFPIVCPPLRTVPYVIGIGLFCPDVVCMPDHEYVGFSELSWYPRVFAVPKARCINVPPMNITAAAARYPPIAANPVALAKAAPPHVSDATRLPTPIETTDSATVAIISRGFFPWPFPTTGENTIKSRSCTA